MATFTPAAPPFDLSFDTSTIADITWTAVAEYPFEAGVPAFLMRATVIATSAVVYWVSSTPDATYAPGGSAAVTDVVIFKVL